MLTLKIFLNTAYLSEKAASGVYINISKKAKKGGFETAALLCEKLSKSEKAHANMIKSCLNEMSE